MAKRTEEYLAMIKATVRLTDAVKNELTPLSQELVARELISVDQGVELRNGNVGAVDRAANLVALVTNKVGQDRKNFYLFVEVLTNSRSIYKEILEDLEPIYKTGARSLLTVNQPWYHRRLSREDAENKLGGIDTDTFLVRERPQEAGKLVLSVKSGSKFYHFPIERGVGSYQVEGTEEPFPSVAELIDHYIQHGLPESDSGELVVLKSPCICDTCPLLSHSKSANGEAITLTLGTSSVPKPARSSIEYAYVDVSVDDYDYDYDKRHSNPLGQLECKNASESVFKLHGYRGSDYINNDPEGFQHSYINEEFLLQQKHTENLPVAADEIASTDHTPQSRGRVGSTSSIVRKLLEKVVKPKPPQTIHSGTISEEERHIRGPREERPIVHLENTPPQLTHIHSPAEERPTICRKNVPPPKPPPYIQPRPQSEAIVTRPSPHVQKPQSEFTVKAQMPYWYRPQFSREEAISFVRSLDPGSFIVRNSTTTPGGYAMTIKISQDQVRQRRKMAEAAPVTENMLVTHFLILPDPEGVKLQGWNERAFETLPEFIAHHTVEKLCLPCKLVLPKSSSGGGGAPQVRRKPALMKQALQTGAVCELVYLGSVEVSGLGSESVVRETVEQLKTLGLSTIMNIVTFKASMSGIELTDDINGLYIKRQYPLSSITYCGLDPSDTRWDFPNMQHLGETISLSNKPCFGLVLRPLDSTGNTCLVFAEFDSTQPVTSVVNYVQRTMSLSRC